jgi:hypothetical protein
MALMLGKLYDALRAGGVPDDKAREAAEEVATYEKDLAEIKSDVCGCSNRSPAPRLPACSRWCFAPSPADSSPYLPRVGGDGLSTMIH